MEQQPLTQSEFEQISNDYWAARPEPIYLDGVRLGSYIHRWDPSTGNYYRWNGEEERQQAIAADIKATRTTPPSGYREASVLSTCVKLILDQPNPVKGMVLSNNSTNTYDAAKEN